MKKRRHRRWALVRLVLRAAKPGCGFCRSGLMVLSDLRGVNQTFPLPTKWPSSAQEIQQESICKKAYRGKNEASIEAPTQNASTESATIPPLRFN